MEGLRFRHGHFSPEYGGSMFGRNLGIVVADFKVYLEECMAHHSTRSQFEHTTVKIPNFAWSFFAFWVSTKEIGISDILLKSEQLFHSRSTEKL